MITQVQKYKPDNLLLAARAVEAIPNPFYPAKCGYCQMFVRLVVQSLYGSQFDRWLWKPSADEAARAFMKSPYYVHPSRGTVPGDILYWFGNSLNRFGHVAIRVPGNMIAENSTRQKGAKYACKGLYPVTMLRPVSVVVRLPESLISR